MTTNIASFRIDGTRSVPVPQEENHTLVSDLTHLSDMIDGDIRRKPSYTDCWLLNGTENLKDVRSYLTDHSSVSIGLSDNGEMEYVVQPVEYSYPDSLNDIILDLIDSIRWDYRENGGRIDRESVRNDAKESALERISDIEGIVGTDSDIGRLIEDICSVVYRYSVGPGVFDILLSDPHIEDIYIDAPCDRNRIYVTLNGIEGMNSHIRCRTNLMVEKREVSNLINILKRESGLRYCQSSPILETDYSEYDARATIVGPPISPEGDAVSLRRHSSRPWTLSRLIYNGTLDPISAGMISYLVDNRCTFLICGPRGAGKSSLLSAMLFEFPVSQRILTIEDTIELPGDEMRRLGYKVQTMLIDDKMGKDRSSRSDEALRLSLRMGESAIVLGEVRGDEARTLYQSMRVGRAGSSIMGTIHGDSAESVFKRVVNDMGVSLESFMSTDIVITLGTIRDNRTGNLIRRVNEIVTTMSEPGRFSDISTLDLILESDIVRRSMSISQTGKRDVMKEIRARADMRSALAEAGRNDERYLGPEWILKANDMLKRSKNDPSTAVMKLREQIFSR